MHKLRDVLLGPTRAVAVLSFTEILAWGILIYPPVLTVPHIAVTHGWSFAFGMAGLSIALIVSGLLSPTACGLIDRHGGNWVMAAGACSAAVGLAGIAFADHPIAYLACWIFIGAGMATNLYDPAFATLTRIFGATARRQITFVTFAGGFASTVGWPATHLLLEHVGWRGTYLVFAAIFAGVIVPLHIIALPRSKSSPALSQPTHAEAQRQIYLPSRGWPFGLMAAAFTLYAFLLSGVTSNLLAMLERSGIPSATAVTIGALFGPSQVAARLGDFVFAGRTTPLWIARVAVSVVTAAFAMLALSGISTSVAMAFAIMFGAANGVITIARGALPLMLFGPEGYGRVIGRIARPALIFQALAPFAVASAAAYLSDRTVLEMATVLAVAVLICLVALRPPAQRAIS